MCEIVREMSREELIAYNNLRESRLENEKLKLENEKLKKELEEARLAVEHNNNLVQEERLKRLLYGRDGEIQGLRFAIRCITGGFSRRGDLDEVE